MNKLNYTPGPWKAHATGLARSGKPEFEIHWSEEGECVAEVVHGCEDACLIALAPEMLEALLEVRLIDHTAKRIGIIDRVVARLETELEAARKIK